MRPLSEEGRRHEEHAIWFVVGTRRMRFVGTGSVYRGSGEDGTYYQHLTDPVATMGTAVQRLQVWLITPTYVSF